MARAKNEIASRLNFVACSNIEGVYVNNLAGIDGRGASAVVDVACIGVVSRVADFFHTGSVIKMIKYIPTNIKNPNEILPITHLRLYVYLKKN